jgi:hypothetical protein
MANLMKLFSTEGKGAKSTYRPPAGTKCLISPPNCDDDDGYVFLEMEILWCDDLFVVYHSHGCWPNVHKWEHIIAKPLPGAPQETTSGEGSAP